MVGTNGKGSVSTMLAAGLSAAGMRTGRFLSPHVEEFTERVALDGRPVGRDAVAAFAARARELDAAWPHGEATRPAFFEWTLALALTEFARAGAEAAVLEAGVGGRHDATRAIEPVALTVLTNVDLDHLDVLGSSLEEIAADKAGAFREGVPVVCGARQPGAVAVAREAAARLGAPFHLDEGDAGPIGSRALFTLPPASDRALAAGAGRLQANRRANSRLAAAALRLLGADEAAVAAGLRAPALPARLERFVLPAGGGEVTVILDGAHDPAAAAALALEVQPGYALVFGALARKQGPKTLAPLAEGASRVIVTEAAPGDGPAAAPEGGTFVADAGAALDAAVAAAAGAGNGTVLVAGSLYLAGLVRPLLRARGRRLPDTWEARAGS